MLATVQSHRGRFQAWQNKFSLELDRRTYTAGIDREELVPWPSSA
jgi:hypothetical protein